MRRVKVALPWLHRSPASPRRREESADKWVVSRPTSLTPHRKPDPMRRRHEGGMAGGPCGVGTGEDQSESLRRIIVSGNQLFQRVSPDRQGIVGRGLTSARRTRRLNWNIRCTRIDTIGSTNKNEPLACLCCPSSRRILLS